MSKLWEWCVVTKDGQVAVSRRDKKTAARFMNPGDRLVRLVPYSPAEARLVRAAMRFVSRDTSWPKNPWAAKLARAVAAVERERRKKR